jgi:hypothetical protein
MTFRMSLKVKTIDLRRHARISLVLFGRCRLTGAGSFPCNTQDVSAGGVALHASVAPPVGSRASVALDKIGEFEGEITRLFPGGFALSFDLGREQRLQLEQRLMRLALQAA